jgi:hypothetical protein
VTHTFLDPRCPRCAPLRAAWEASAIPSRQGGDVKQAPSKKGSAAPVGGDAQ